MRNLRYLLGAMLAIPVLPIIYFQGKRVKNSVPKLPEAKDPSGVVSGQLPPFQLITLGESTIAGVGVQTHEEGFTGTLAKILSSQLDVSVAWKVYAKSGYTVKAMQRKLVPGIEEKNIHLIVVGAGGNDSFQLNSPWKWKNDVNTLIKELRKKYSHAPIVFVNMPPIKSFPAFTPLMKFFLGNLANMLGEVLDAEVTRHENVYYYGRKITLEDWIARLNIKAKPAAFFSDGVHPSKLTYQTWAKDLATFMLDNQTLKEVLEQKQRM